MRKLLLFFVLSELSVQFSGSFWANTVVQDSLHWVLQLETGRDNPGQLIIGVYALRSFLNKQLIFLFNVERLSIASRHSEGNHEFWLRFAILNTLRLETLSNKKLLESFW